MGHLLKQLLTADQRTHAVLADIRQAAALRHERDVRALQARIGPLKLQQTMNELQRAQAGIDHTGKPVPRFGAVLAGWRDDEEDARMRLLDEARADTADGAWADDREYEAERRERDSL